jgi:hypothetical protein
MSKTQKNSQVEKAIQTIETRYAIGKEILKRCGQRSPLGLITELAAEHDVNRDHAQKLRAIADPTTGYMKSELNRWFREFRKAGFALTISHFVKLISVPKGETRDLLTRRAIQQEWSTHRLQAEILAVQGRRQAGGRRPKVVIGPQFEQELSQTLWSWSRWLGIQLEEDESMRSEIAKELKSLQRKIGRLQASLDVK